MKLYKAKIEFDMVVCAESEMNAIDLVSDYSVEELGNKLSKDYITYLEEVESKSDLPDGWGDAIPWGDKYDDDRTCNDYLEDNS